MAQTRMSVQDALWLTMDRPNNLMVVDVAVVLAGQPPQDVVRETFRDLVARHPVFGRKAVRRGASWYWVDDPEFDLAQHVTFVTLDNVADLSALQRLVASRRSMPLDRSHPLWSIALVGPIRLDDGSLGTAMAARFHHAIADGVRLTQVMVSLLQGDVKGSVPAIARTGAAGGSLVSVHGMRVSASEAVHVAVSATQAVAGSVGHAVADPLGTAASAASTVAGGFELVRHPDRFVDALEVLGIADHRSINDVASVAKLLLSESDRTVWTGEPGTVKAVAWSPPMPLAEIKRVARARAVTVNDVLVSAVAGALRGYLRERRESADEVTWMVPVNLRPYNQDLPTDLGNYFALVMLPMPLHHDESEARLAEVHHRMQRIKNSDEPVLTFGLQRTISLSPSAIAYSLTNFFANKAVGVLTNVPGPTRALTYAGCPVRQVIGFAPCSGNQPMTATIFTYNETVTVGFATDAVLLPDPERLVALVSDEVAAMAALA